MRLFASLLAAAALGAPAAFAASGPDAEDLSVCAFLAGGTQREIDGYLVKAAIFDLDGDGVAERLGIEDEGTMHIDHYRVRKADGSDPVTIGEPTVEDDDWAWTRSQRWLIYAGRAYVLRFAGYDTGYLRFVSRIGADMVERPLCRFQPQWAIALDPGTPADGSLCKAVAEHRVTYLSIDRLSEPVAAPGHDIVAGKALVTGKLRVDFLNNRRPADAWLYEVDSSAGPGCTLKYFDTAPKGTASVQHTLLAAMQRLDLGDAYTRRTCADAEPRWFTFDHRQFLETESTAADTPGSERDEYRYVDVIEHGKPRRACEASYTHNAPKLTGIWDGAAWAAPPAN